MHCIRSPPLLHTRHALPCVLHVGRDVVLHDERRLDAVRDIRLARLAHLAGVRLCRQRDRTEHCRVAEEAAACNVHTIQLDTALEG